MGGARLNATGKCVYAMRVGEKITFDQYWSDPHFIDKKPVRNGSQKMLVGDNIYHRDPRTHRWVQADSHHSLADGSVNQDNLRRDTSSDGVLISRHFFYFGLNAPTIPNRFLDSIGFENGIGHRVYDESDCRDLLRWLNETFADSLNIVAGDPFDFEKSEARFDTAKNKIS